MNCADCLYSEIADWEQDAKTGKATAIYWCERHKKFCEEIQECSLYDEGSDVE